MLKITAFVTIFTLIFSASANCVENLEIKFISPIGAVARSVIPGWGQFYTHHKLQGVVIFLSIGILSSFGVRADANYRHFYNDFYRPAVLSDSSQASFYFSKSNDYYKLSRFMFYTAAGIWAYSAINAYIDANVYNAQKQTSMLTIDNEKLQTLKPSAGDK